MIEFQLTALSPLDGRYANKVDDLRFIFSEYALIRYRLLIEVRWFETLAAAPEISEVPPLSDQASQFLAKLISDFDETSAKQIKAIEAVTNHDVKAVEYFLKEKFQNHAELSQLSEFIHFACT